MPQRVEGEVRSDLFRSFAQETRVHVAGEAPWRLLMHFPKMQIRISKRAFLIVAKSKMHLQRMQTKQN